MSLPDSHLKKRSSSLKDVKSRRIGVTQMKSDRRDPEAAASRRYVAETRSGLRILNRYQSGCGRCAFRPLQHDLRFAQGIRL